MITCGAASGACPSADASASSIAPTTKKCWSSACTRSSCRRRRLPDELDQQSIFGKNALKTSLNFERYLSRNGITVCKFFLDVSREEQKKRFLERLDNPEKNWKFSHR